MSRRGQLVLVAAVVVAAALVPMLVAYLQLGYPADAAVERTDPPSVSDARRALDVATYRAATAVVRTDRSSANASASLVERDLARAAESLDARGAPRDRVYRVRGNESAATVFARTNCPGGERRQFGRCRVVDGVVVQNRVGTWTVVAVAVDLRIVGPETRTRVTFVLRPYR